MLQSPDLNCANVLSNGDILLTWSNPDPDACGAFVGYVIYASNTLLGPYIAIDTVTLQSQTTYTYSPPTSGTWYFYLETFYNCFGYTSLSSDTLDSNKPLPPVIVVNVTGNGWDLFRKNVGVKVPNIALTLERPVEIRKIVASTLSPVIASQIGALQVNYIVSDTLRLKIEPKIQLFMRGLTC